MPEFKLRHLQFERDTWKRLLGYMKVESIYLKYRLAEILKNNIDENLLEEMENFHSRLLKQDEFNTLLDIEISALDKLMSKEVQEGIAKVENKVNALRKDIENAELQFSRLKSEFGSRVSGMMQFIETR